ncbi:trypsin-like peptidase domain-containing protein [Methylacidiphilales bacterium]|nr:trypsin-like peptidase domain-containing protein [Candidatus Methylacidiphilales bacterium]
MKRLSCFALAALLALSGCGKAPDVATNNQTSNKKIPTPLPPAQTETPTASPTPATFTPATQNPISPEDVPLLEQINRENIKVAAAVTPSVVRIIANRPIDPHLSLSHNGLLPFHFHFGPGGPLQSFQENDPVFGSGVIISKDGYLVTNNHVIEGAKDVQVQLQNKRTYPAKVVAADPSFDVAVLKIDASDLSALPWGDSDKVQVGEQVFAIGNPFDLEDSVSKGIVSAKGRNMENSSNYEDYIQTDAAINPGNSGGALVNIHGELIGLNAAIASTSRVNMGVAFAIPSNLVRYAVESLLKDGKLVRGYLGVKLPMTVDDGVIAQLGLDTVQGALLAGVQRDSPADQAKLRPVDFITAVDGHKVESEATLRLIVAQIPIGKEVAVDYIRDGTPQSTQLKIAEAPDPSQMEMPLNDENENVDLIPASSPSHQAAGNTVLSGIQVVDLPDKIRQKFSQDHFDLSGVIISDIAQGSPADERGLSRGDVIEVASTQRSSIQTITNAKDFLDITKTVKPSQSVVLLVHHGKTSSFVYLAPPK